MLKFTPKRRLTGGVRLPPHKAESTAQPIARGFIPPQLIVSLQQQRGSAAKPVVEIGQLVARGQTIARSESTDGADLHAPTSGTITAIETRPVPLTSLTESSCIIIETDGADRPVESSEPVQIAQSAEGRLQQIVEAGIVGLGGAVYPTAAKLKQEPDQHARLLIINGAECEPYISCDDMLMREASEEIIAGAEILRQLIDAPECIVAIERDKPQAIDAMTAAAEKLKLAHLRIAELPSIYPAGGERQLVEVLTGVEVPSTSYPGDVGFPCQNVGTAYAVYRYFRLGEPLTSRIVTVTGGAITRPQNIEAMIGTPISDLIEACGGYRGQPARLIQGGSMMGFALNDDALPITKATNCIIAAESFEVHQDRREWPCIRCGECSIACPVRLQPQDLVLAARESNAAALSALELSECIECGCCDVVCPSHIPLTQVFRTAKPLVRELAQQKAFSEASELRFQNHEQRRHDAEIEEDQRRNEIKRVLSVDQQRADEIKAAVERARQRRTDSDGS
jgi:Na+-translocating ferredoxin:NAD+ oxidoreductase subunit C